MQTLFPPDYPDNPDAPLTSFGLAFSQEISRSLIHAVFPRDDEHPHEADVPVAAALTMLEAFHPRDQLECMLAAQGVAAHAAIMESYRVAMDPELPREKAAKLRANATQLGRTFSTVMHDLERRQAKPLAARPPEPPRPVEPAKPETVAEDIQTRPDGTPGSLAAYAPAVPEKPFVFQEPLIMRALATRPKPWRVVNEQPGTEIPPDEPELPEAGGGPLNLTEKIYGGDGLARFAAARFDPNAVPPATPAEDEAIFEIGVISTGGDPEMEALRDAMAAANPEGKPVRTIRYGRAEPPDSS